MILNRLNFQMIVGYVCNFEFNLLVTLQHQLIEWHQYFCLSSLILMKNILPLYYLNQILMQLAGQTIDFFTSELDKQKIFILELVFLAVMVYYIRIGALGIGQFGYLYSYSELFFDYFELAHWVFVDLVDGGS